MATVYCNTRFEEIGVNRIEHCDRSFADVEDSFNTSCTLCTMHKRRGADCSACPIREAAIAKAKWHGSPEAYLWIEQEEEAQR